MNERSAPNINRVISEFWRNRRWDADYVPQVFHAGGQRWWSQLDQAFFTLEELNARKDPDLFIDIGL